MQCQSVRAGWAKNSSTPVVPYADSSIEQGIAGWAVASGVATLARRHPLTVEGEEIGSFDLVVACSPGADTYDVSYIERRHRGEQTPLPAAIDSISLRVGSNSAMLKVV